MQQTKAVEALDCSLLPSCLPCNVVMNHFFPKEDGVAGCCQRSFILEAFVCVYRVIESNCPGSL